jgi:predicted phosphodiesterase
MRVFALSDIHIDFHENEGWLFGLSSVDFQEDILILAGDVTDNLHLLNRCFRKLGASFKKVLYTPGNHELWVVRDGFCSSFDKYLKICEMAMDFGILMQPYHMGSLSIVPLLGWYDFSFGKPNAQLRETWMDFYNCVWSKDPSMSVVSDFFLKKNTSALNICNTTVISFSHFLPRLDLIPSYVPSSFDYLNPVMGSEFIEEQIRRLKPQIHIFGHRHVHCQVNIDGIIYINNAFGYPYEHYITTKELLCVFEH